MGTVVDKPCSGCRGTGVKEKSKKMTLTIPAGVDNGKRIAIPHQGDVGENGGPAGDLIVILHVENHPTFERDGQDLYCAVPITFAQAILGCNITITSLDNKKINLSIPSGTSHGKLLRIKGEGVPFTNSSRRGDLYVKVMIQIPQRLSSKQKDLLTQYLELDNATTEPKLIPLSSLNN
jgi:molecular chaperone DnaJ